MECHHRLELMADLNQALQRTERLFRMQKGISTPRPAISEFGAIMADVCGRQGVDPSGAKDLQALGSEFERLGRSEVTETEIIAARQCLNRYLAWLQLHFPVAFISACQLTPRPPELLCEQCGRSVATVHITQISPEGVVRRDLCEVCHRQASGE